MFKLTDLTVTRIDVVPRGASPGADILLIKGDTPKHESRIPIPEEWRGWAAGGREGRRLWVDDRHSIASWAEALPRAVNAVPGDPAVYINYGPRVPTVRDQDVLKLASLLPLDCERHVFLNHGKERAELWAVVPVNKSVAWMQNQLAQGHQIMKSLQAERIAKAKEQVMQNLPDDATIKKGLEDGDKTALAACRKGFEQLTAACEQDVNTNRLSGREQSELRMLDAGSQMSLAEKGGIIAGLRAPGLYEAYARAVGAGIA